MDKQQPESRELAQKERYSHRNNMAVFGILLIVIQITISILYGIYCTSPPNFINISSIVINIFLVIFIILGFGLYLGFFQSLVWSGIGFAFLNVILTVIVYPLVNLFWTQFNVFDNPRVPTTSNSKGFDLFLASYDNNQNTGNESAGAMRCALAIVVASSGIIGRGTPIDYLLLSVVGTFAFELNRQLAANIGLDHFGTFTIFGFGGAVSLGMGILFLSMEPVRGRSRKEIESSKTSVSQSLLGSIVMFLFFPVLLYQGDGSMVRQVFSSYTSAASVLLSMSSSMITGLALSMLINIKPRIREIQNNLLAGAIVGGSASYFITNPSYSIVCGVTATLFQLVFQFCIERPLYKKIGLVCTYFPSVFLLQSIIGCYFMAIFTQGITNGFSDNFSYTKTVSVSSVFKVCFMSIGIGLAVGLLIGLLCRLFRLSSFRVIYMHDRQFWLMHDMIGYKNKPREPTVKITKAKLATKEYEKYAPGIAASMARTNRNKQHSLGKSQRRQGSELPSNVGSHWDADDIDDLELDFVDMLQVIE